MFRNQLFTIQPDEDDDDDDEEDEDEESLLALPALCSVNLTTDDVISFSLSFLLPVQTDLWAGLNCHVTFFDVDDCSTGAIGLAGAVTELAAMGRA